MNYDTKFEHVTRRELVLRVGQVTLSPADTWGYMQVCEGDVCRHVYVPRLEAAIRQVLAEVKNEVAGLTRE